jgi:hypothetical protein
MMMPISEARIMFRLRAADRAAIERIAQERDEKMSVTIRRLLRAGMRLEG